MTRNSSPVGSTPAPTLREILGRPAKVQRKEPSLLRLVVVGVIAGAAVWWVAAMVGVQIGPNAIG